MQLQHGTLVVEDLHMTYRMLAEPVQAVRGVSFAVAPGEFYTLLGASGFG
jgi:ABC-type glutathione transport system ATPase component